VQEASAEHLVAQHVLPPGLVGKAGPEPARSAVPTDQEDEGARLLAAAGVMQAGEEAHAAVHAVALEATLHQHAPDATVATAQVCQHRRRCRLATSISMDVSPCTASWVAQAWQNRLLLTAMSAMPLTLQYEICEAAVQDSLNADAVESMYVAAGPLPAMLDALVVSGLRAFASAPDEAWPS